VFVVHGTKKFLDRVGASTDDATPSTTVLGAWYATILFWNPRAALFTNEATLFPVLLPFAPASTLRHRFPEALERILRSQGLDRTFIEHEISEMIVWRTEKDRKPKRRRGHERTRQARFVRGDH